MISAKLIASSTPGMAKARSCIMVPIIPLLSAMKVLELERGRVGGDGDWGGRTLLDHLLDGACGVNLHGEEVIEAIDFGSVL